jgi:hypothetical protein
VFFRFALNSVLIKQLLVALDLFLPCLSVRFRTAGFLRLARRASFKQAVALPSLAAQPRLCRASIFSAAVCL